MKKGDAAYKKLEGQLVEKIREAFQKKYGVPIKMGEDGRLQRVDGLNISKEQTIFLEAFHEGFHSCLEWALTNIGKTERTSIEKPA